MCPNTQIDSYPLRFDSLMDCTTSKKRKIARFKLEICQRFVDVCEAWLDERCVVWTWSFHLNLRCKLNKSCDESILGTLHSTAGTLKPSTMPKEKCCRIMFIISETVAGSFVGPSQKQDRLTHQHIPSATTPLYTVSGKIWTSFPENRRSNSALVNTEAEHVINEKNVLTSCLAFLIQSATTELKGFLLKLALDFFERVHRPTTKTFFCFFSKMLSDSEGVLAQKS